MLITGGSTGIGAATAKIAISEGYTVIATARTKKNLELLKAEINSQNFDTFVCDISKWESMQSLKEYMIKKYTKVDIVFANAGYTAGIQSFLDGNNAENVELWKQMILVNVFGAAITASTFLPELVKTKGQFIITGSVVGRFSVSGRMYSSTKFAVTGMADSIRKEMVGKNVRVTLLEPGMVETPFWENGVASNNALTAEDVAKCAIFVTKQPDNVDISELMIRPTGQVI